MEFLGILVENPIILTIYSLLPYILTPLLIFIIIKILMKRRNYSGKISEMKEAPLDISNLLKDHVKRKIIRTLRKERKYVSAISREIHEDAPRTRYHLKQLEKSGLIKSFKLARESYFSLTKKGLWCLNTLEYYYPTTNLQFIKTRFRKYFGTSKLRKLYSKEKDNHQN